PSRPMSTGVLSSIAVVGRRPSTARTRRMRIRLPPRPRAGEEMAVSDVIALCGVRVAENIAALISRSLHRTEHVHAITRPHYAEPFAEMRRSVAVQPHADDVLAGRVGLIDLDLLDEARAVLDRAVDALGGRDRDQRAREVRGDVEAEAGGAGHRAGLHDHEAT